MSCVIYVQTSGGAMKPFDPANMRVRDREVDVPSYKEENADAIVLMLADKGIHAMAKEVMR